MLARAVIGLTSLVRKSSSSAPVTNNSINPFVTNRNPKNLEKLRLQKKPCGYSVDNEDVEYFHRYKLFNIFYYYYYYSLI